MYQHGTYKLSNRALPSGVLTITQRQRSNDIRLREDPPNAGAYLAVTEIARWDGDRVADNKVTKSWRWHLKNRVAGPEVAQFQTRLLKLHCPQLTTNYCGTHNK